MVHSAPHVLTARLVITRSHESLCRASLSTISSTHLGKDTDLLLIGKETTTAEDRPLHIVNVAPTFSAFMWFTTTTFVLLNLGLWPAGRMSALIVRVGRLHQKKLAYRVVGVQPLHELGLGSGLG